MSFKLALPNWFHVGERSIRDIHGYLGTLSGAFDASTGHKHTGVDGDGGALTLPPRVATFVLAASDAPANWKASADLVSDGTDDAADFITALGTGSTEITLSPGTFHFTAPHTSAPNTYLKPKAVIAGQGIRTVIKAEAGLGPNYLFDADSGLTNGMDDFTMRDLVIDGNSVVGAIGLHPVYSRRVALERILFQNLLGGAIYAEPFTGSYGWRIADCYFLACGSSSAGAVVFVSASGQNLGLRVTGCTFDTPAAGAPALDVLANDCLVDRNVVLSAGADGIVSSGRNSILGNVVQGAVGAGIIMDGTDGSAECNVVRGAAVGLHVLNTATGAFVTNNDLKGNTTALTDNGTGTVTAAGNRVA